MNDVLTLKEINFIGVLKMINEDKLRELIQESDTMKVFNAVGKCTCECGKFMYKHDMCDTCDNYICNGFISKSGCMICFNCAKDGDFWIEGEYINVEVGYARYKMKMDSKFLSYKIIKGLLKNN